MRRTGFNKIIKVSKRFNRYLLLFAQTIHVSQMLFRYFSHYHIPPIVRRWTNRVHFSTHTPAWTRAVHTRNCNWTSTNCNFSQYGGVVFLVGGWEKTFCRIGHGWQNPCFLCPFSELKHLVQNKIKQYTINKQINTFSVNT